MARTINTAATNTANAMLTITPTIKILLGNNFVAAHHLKNITDKLVETVKIDVKKGVYNLTKQIAYKLKTTPDAGTDEEIQSAHIIIDAYLKHDTKTASPTQPSTPLPIPIHNYQEIEYENLNHITKSDNLLVFMNHVPPVKKTTLFKPLTDFTTIVKDREKDENFGMKYWMKSSTRKPSKPNIAAELYFTSNLDPCMPLTSWDATTRISTSLPPPRKICLVEWVLNLCGHKP
jgi:hypothetical protein